MQKQEVPYDMSMSSDLDMTMIDRLKLHWFMLLRWILGLDRKSVV